MSSQEDREQSTSGVRETTESSGMVRITLALLLVTAAVYWSVLKCGFVNYDDPVFVLQNPMVQKGLTAEALRWAFSSIYIYWQPLTWISYMLEFAMAGPSPRLFHGTNLLLHLASTAILFVALVRMTGSRWRSAAVAALFALHPLHVETVAWVSERKGALSGFFWCLALLAYVRHARRPGGTSLLMVTSCFAMGLMSKSIVVTLPCVLLLLDFWPLRRWKAVKDLNRESGLPSFPARTTSQLLAEKVPLFLLAGVGSYLTVAAQKKMGAVLSAEMFSITDRFAIMVTSYASYLRKLVWPVDLAVFYPNPGAWPMAEVIGSTLVLGAITAVSLWQWRRRPYLITGWLMFLGVMLPVSGILQTGEQLMADRYTYLPLTGIFIMIVWLSSELAERLPNPGAVAATAGAVAVGACALSASSQLANWRDTRSLFEQANRVTRGNYLAHTVLGTILTEERKFDEAFAHFEAALKVQPRYAETHFRMALAYAAQNRWNQAIEHYQLALKEDPANPDVLNGIATALKAKGDLGSASAAWQQLLKAQPQSPAAHHNLALVMHQQGRYSEAIEHYRNCIRIDPSRVEALNNLAWILATHQDGALRSGAEAVQLAEQASKLTARKIPVVIGTLAAAYAESGRFEEAIKATQEAEKLARSSQQVQVAERNAQLRESYKAGKPHREANP